MLWDFAGQVKALGPRPPPPTSELAEPTFRNRMAVPRAYFRTCGDAPTNDMHAAHVPAICQLAIVAERRTASIHRLSHDTLLFCKMPADCHGTGRLVL